MTDLSEKRDALRDRLGIEARRDGDAVKFITFFFAAFLIALWLYIPLGFVVARLLGWE